MSSKKRLEKFEAIIFDFDGTLAELNLDFKEMKRRLGVLALEYLRLLPPSDVPVLEWLEILADLIRVNNGSSPDEFEQRARSLILEMELDAARNGNLFQFTRPVLSELRQRSVKAAVITRNCERAVRLVFPDMEDYCICFLARDHVPRVKPDPDHLLRAIEKANVSPEAALMVGDHPLDVQTGRSAGVCTAGVWSGNATEADLLRSGAHWTARNCKELMEALKKQGLV